jgi:hypothetical protein
MGCFHHIRRKARDSYQLSFQPANVPGYGLEHSGNSSRGQTLLTPGLQSSLQVSKVVQPLQVGDGK